MSECEESRGNMLLTEASICVITTAKCSTVHQRVVSPRQLNVHTGGWMCVCGRVRSIAVYSGLRAGGGGASSA